MSDLDQLERIGYPSPSIPAETVQVCPLVEQAWLTTLMAFQALTKLGVSYWPCSPRALRRVALQLKRAGEQLRGFADDVQGIDPADSPIEWARRRALQEAADYLDEQAGAPTFAAEMIRQDLMR